jgi:hypothetical protein
MSTSFALLERQTVLAPLGLRFRDAVTGEAVGEGLVVTVYPATNPDARTRAFPNRSGAYVVHSAPGLHEATRGAGDEAFWAGLTAKKSFTIEVADALRRYLPFTFTAELPVRGLLTWVWPLEAEGGPAMSAPAVSLRDDFGDGALDASLWTLGTLNAPQSVWDAGVTALEQNGRLEVTPLASASGGHYNGYLSAAKWGGAGARASVEVARVTEGAAETIFTLALDAANWFRFVVQAGQLLFQSRVGGAETSAALAYDPAPHRWWSLRHDAADDEVSFETSADGRAWTRRRVVPRQFPLSAVTIELGAGSSASVGSPGVAAFDNFKLESNPAPFVPLFSAPTRAPQGGAAVLRAELWDPTAGGGAGAPASFALLEARLAGRPTLRGVADSAGRVALVFPYPEPSGAPDGQGGSLPPPAYTSQEWEVGLRAFYAPRQEAAPLPDINAAFAQPAANLWADEARAVPLTKDALRFGQELVVRSLAGAPPETTPLPVLLITPAT